MRRAIDQSAARPLIQTATELLCPHCQGDLGIFRHRDRFVYRLDGLVHQICRDKKCPDKECGGRATLYRPLVDLRLALPQMSFGLDVVVAVGEEHLRDSRSLSEIGRKLSNDGVPIHQTHVGRLFRVFLTLCKMGRGDEQKVQQRLLGQGGIVLMVDGVQFDDRSPVLYLVWDAVSGTPLFAERREDRSARGLRELLLRVNRMGVPVLGIVTDGEKGLVPAVQEVFPGVPYQLCQTHFLKNCARPMEPDLQALGASVSERAEKVRKLQKRLDKSLEGARAPVDPQGPQTAATAPNQQAGPDAPAAPQSAQEAGKVGPKGEPITEQELVGQLGELARLNARLSGKAPLHPPELVRHQRLEQVREAVQEAAKKKTDRRPGWMPWTKRSSRTGSRSV